LFEHRHVSIIDDDQSVRVALGSLARSLGMSVRLFASAEAFLAAEGALDNDLIVTDVQMPGMGGLALLELLHQRGGTVPAIVLTAFPEGAIRERARAAGARAFLAKPFDGDAIIDCMRHALAPAGSAG